jgi:hypothetical protein
MKILASVLLAACALAAAAAQAMEFHRVGATLVLSGPVAGSDLARLRDHLADGAGIELVLLHDSPGGDLFNAYLLANRIRAEGLATAVAGKCESACGLIFLGGVQRSFSDGAPLGQTMISLHGAHHFQTRQAMPELGARMAYVISSYTDRKFPAELLQRTVYPKDPADAVFAFHPDKYPSDGTPRGIVECLKQADARFACTMLPGLDAIAIGVVTNPGVLALDPQVRAFLQRPAPAPGA